MRTDDRTGEQVTDDRRQTEPMCDVAENQGSPQASGQCEDEGVFVHDSVPEVPASGEHHRKPAFVRCCNHVLIADRSAGLHDSGCACIGDDIETIAEWKERIRCGDRAFQRIRPNGFCLHAG